MLRSTVRFIALACSAVTFAAHAADKIDQGNPIQTVTAQRIFSAHFSCSDHLQGELLYAGDALGKDCRIEELETIDGRTFARAYRGLGERNEDWYGWDKDVLSPCTCKVSRVSINETVNAPGTTGSPPATVVVLTRSDGVTFIVAHLAHIVVKEADEVKAGAKLGRVGNNGYARNPHIHIGAFKDKRALQIVFDNSTE